MKDFMRIDQGTVMPLDVPFQIAISKLSNDALKKLMLLAMDYSICKEYPKELMTEHDELLKIAFEMWRDAIDSFEAE